MDDSDRELAQGVAWSGRNLGDHLLAFQLHLFLYGRRDLPRGILFFSTTRIYRRGMPVSATPFGARLADSHREDLVRNPIFLDRVSGFDWTVIPILSGQSFSLFLPAVVAC